LTNVRSTILIACQTNGLLGLRGLLRLGALDRADLVVRHRTALSGGARGHARARRAPARFGNWQAVLSPRSLYWDGRSKLGGAMAPPRSLLATPRRAYRPAPSLRGM